MVVRISNDDAKLDFFNPTLESLSKTSENGCRDTKNVFFAGRNAYLTTESAVSTVNSLGNRVESRKGFLYAGIDESKQVFPPIIQRESLLQSVAYSNDGSLIAFSFDKKSLIVARGDGTVIGSWKIDTNKYISPRSLQFTPDGRSIVASGNIFTTLDARGITQASLSARASAPTLTTSLAKIDALCGTGALSLSQCLRIREIVQKDQITTYPELAAWLEGAITDAEFVRRWKARG